MENEPWLFALAEKEPPSAVGYPNVMDGVTVNSAGYPAQGSNYWL